MSVILAQIDWPQWLGEELASEQELLASQEGVERIADIVRIERNRYAPSSSAKKLTPVTFPLGWLRRHETELDRISTAREYDRYHGCCSLGAAAAGGRWQQSHSHGDRPNRPLTSVTFHSHRPPSGI